MHYEQEVLDVATPFALGLDDHSPPSPRDDRTGHPAQHQWAANTATALPEVPHEPSPEIREAMLAAAYGRQLVDRLAALQNEEVTKYTGISRDELGLRVWNAPMAQVAKRLEIRKHVLTRICKLYEVPTPPKGYFKTSFAKRPIRWTRVAVAGSSQ